MRRRAVTALWLAIDIALVVVFFWIASSCSDALWAITHGTDRLHARRSDFVDGTTRHARSWDEVAQRECDCLGVPNPGVDSLFAGGIWIVGDPFSVYRWPTQVLRISDHDYDLGGPLEHEIYHALARRFARLRHPLDSLDVGGEFDHAMMIRVPHCVHWCPPDQSGCRGELPH